MTGYENSKVYAILSPHTDKMYVGSTKHTLEQRFAGHMSKSQTCMSKEIIKCGDAYITLIMNCCCQTRQELEWYENRCMREFDNLVNKQEPTGELPREKRTNKIIKSLCQEIKNTCEQFKKNEIGFHTTQQKW